MFNIKNKWTFIISLFPHIYILGFLPSLFEYVLYSTYFYQSVLSNHTIWLCDRGIRLFLINLIQASCLHIFQAFYSYIFQVFFSHKFLSAIKDWPKLPGYRATPVVIQWCSSAPTIPSYTYTKLQQYLSLKFIVRYIWSSLWYIMNYYNDGVRIHQYVRTKMDTSLWILLNHTSSKKKKVYAYSERTNK